MYYIQVPTIVGLDKAPSPNGKATDSDSVIFKVRILVALLAESSHGLRAFSFTNVESCEKYYVCKKVHAGA